MNEVFWAVALHVFNQIETARIEAIKTAINSLPEASHIMAAMGEREIMRKQDNIAIIDISGLMMRNPGIFEQVFMGATDTNAILAAVNAAGSDSGVDKVLLNISSPGGAVAGTSELGDAVAAVNAVKPVTAYTPDICASAAYWVASQAGKIYANPSAIVGSIGVRMALYDTSKAYEQAGIKAIPIDSGKFKSAGSPGTEITEEQIQMFQDIVTEHFARFASAVKTGRGMSDNKFVAVADAQILSADKAKSAGLIDGVSTIAEVMKGLLRKQAGRNTSVNRARLAII